MRRALLVLLVLLAPAAACAGDDGGDEGEAATSTTTSAPLRALDDELRLNDIQVLGSHNSYHVQAIDPVFEALQAFDANLANTLEYGHEPLDAQLGEQGIRQFELDAFADPDGGRYATPAGPEFVGAPHEPDPAMLEPGFKVFHIQDIDYRSTCPTLVACLTVIRDWSAAHPGHAPVVVMVEVKDGAIPDPGLGFVVPPPTTPADLDALDAEIRSVFDDDHLITPDDVRGDQPSLEAAVLDDGWPTLGASRGKVLFGMINGGAIRDLYVEGHPSLEGRVMFTGSPAGSPEAAFLRIDDPVENQDKIQEAVRAGYIVRTRADADTAQARTGDTTMRDAALRSGAQFVSTDYPVDDARFEADYVVAIPGGTPARCNPVRNPPGCRPADVEDPDLLKTPARGGTVRG